jgi:HD-GYP domain-containing protein (c-di-GMP phosphodiesterase class II)
MRYIDIEQAKPGAFLMRDIYGYNGEILLRKGLKLDQSYITKLKILGINGLYISDNLSEEVEVESLISDSLKNKAVCDVRKTFKLFDNPNITRKEAEASYNTINNTVSDFITEIKRKPDLCINMIDLKLFDDYTYYHCVNVALLSIVLGMAFGLNNDIIQDLGVSAILHDIGKVHVPRLILRKKDQLNHYEYRTIQKHVSWGFEYARDKLFLKYDIAKGVLQHHERWDGSGYPNKLKGREISIFGRIIAISDVYDALVSDRPYRKGFRPAEALEFLLGNGETDFDVDLLNIFNKKIQPYPPGTVVELSNNLKALVLRVKPGFGTRPTVKVFESDGEKITPYVLDLSMSNHNSIIITN